MFASNALRTSKIKSSTQTKPNLVIEKKLYSEPKPSQTENAKGLWGPAFWTTLHILAATYTIDKKESVLAYINSLGGLLPCDECRRHYRKMLKEFPVDPYLSNNHDLFFWTYLIHDRVNLNINQLHSENKKMSPNFDVVKRYYFSKFVESCGECGGV